MRRCAIEPKAKTHGEGARAERASTAPQHQLALRHSGRGQVRASSHDLANLKGRRFVEGLWPDVQWTNDHFRAHSAQWLFTHVRVTRLPPHLEETTPLAFATPNSLALAVAMALLFRGICWHGLCGLHTTPGRVTTFISIRSARHLMRQKAPILPYTPTTCRRADIHHRVCSAAQPVRPYRF